MAIPQKPREEPKLQSEDSEKKSDQGQTKRWPKEEDFAAEGEERTQEIAGILEHPSYKELEKKLTEMEEKANDYWNQQLRSQAEIDNVRRRAERDVANAHKYALEKLISDLLPVVDSLERALSSDVSDNLFAKKIHEGIELTMTLTLKTLEKHQVQQIDPQGEMFNPELHQAISTQPSDEPPNKVIQVLQKGYTLQDRLIRPALVVVSAASNA